jgi:integrase/recombinase XerD
MTSALSAFGVYGVASGHSARTIGSRMDLLSRLAQTHDLATVTEEELVVWLAGLGVSRPSLATYRAHLRAFFRWMRKTGRRPDDPAADLPMIRAGRGVPHPVTPEAVTAILRVCEDPRTAQTRAYVILGAFAGLRVHEIAKVRGEDFLDGQIHVRGKGGSSLSVPLHPRVSALAETMPRRGFWFPSAVPRGHVSRIAVSQAITRAMVRAEVPGVPHALRHHFGTEVLRSSGGNLRVAQRALRHASPATTAVYTLIAGEELTSAVTGIRTADLAMAGAR